MVAMNESQQPEKCYRPRRALLLLGIGVTALLLMTGLGFLVAVLTNQISANVFPAPAAFLACLVWAIFLLLGIKLTLDCLRERLILTEDTITFYNFAGVAQIPVDQISQVVWLTGSGATRVESSEQSFKFNIESFVRPEQREIIQYLHHRVDIRKQTKWKWFYDSYRQVMEPDAKASRDDLIVTGICLASAGFLGYLLWIEAGFGKLLAMLFFVAASMRRYLGK
jgi:hypothetical protein